MPHFVNFKNVEIFEPLLLITKKTEIRLFVIPATIYVIKKLILTKGKQPPKKGK